MPYQADKPAGTVHCPKGLTRQPQHLTWPATGAAVMPQACEEPADTADHAVTSVGTMVAPEGVEADVSPQHSRAPPIWIPHVYMVPAETATHFDTDPPGTSRGPLYPQPQHSIVELARMPHACWYPADTATHGPTLAGTAVWPYSG